MSVLGWVAVTVALCWYQLWSRRSVASLVFCCEDARKAYRNTELVWSDVARGWVVLTLPLRRSSWRARYLASEGQAELHDGEPYLWSLCPFCQGELPYGHSMLTDGTSTED